MWAVSGRTLTRSARSTSAEACALALLAVLYATTSVATPRASPGISTGTVYRSCKHKPLSTTSFFRRKPYDDPYRYSSSSSSSSGGGYPKLRPILRKQPPLPPPSSSSKIYRIPAKARRYPDYRPSSSSSGSGSSSPRKNEVWYEAGFKLSRSPPSNALAKVCGKFRCCKLEGKPEEAKDCCYAFGNCCKQAFKEYDAQCDIHHGKIPMPYPVSPSSHSKSLISKRQVLVL